MKVKQYSKTAKPKLHPTQEENRTVCAHSHINFFLYIFTAYVYFNFILYETQTTQTEEDSEIQECNHQSTNDFGEGL